MGKLKYMTARQAKQRVTNAEIKFAVLVSVILLSVCGIVFDVYALM